MLDSVLNTIFDFLRILLSSIVGTLRTFIKLIPELIGEMKRWRK